MLWSIEGYLIKERMSKMNNEEYKLKILQMSKEQPELMSKLALAVNLGHSERKEVYSPAPVYRHGLTSLFTRIVTRQNEDNSLEFDIQFHDGEILPEGWAKSVDGEFGVDNLLRNIDYEHIQFSKDSILFKIRRELIYAQEDEPFLKTKEIELSVFKIYTDRDYLYFGHIEAVDVMRLCGRDNYRFKTEYFIDYEGNEAQLQKLCKAITEWGEQHNPSEEKMRKINDFCLFCMKVKGTKKKSKMVRIMEYFMDNHFSR